MKGRSLLRLNISAHASVMQTVMNAIDGVRLQGLERGSERSSRLLVTCLDPR